LLFLFEDFALDTKRRELRRGPTLVPVEPQVLDILALLISNRDRVVSREELLAEVWHGRIVSESTLATRIHAARRVLGDSGEHQRLIHTVLRRGLRFVGSAREAQDVAPIDYQVGSDDFPSFFGTDAANKSPDSSTAAESHLSLWRGRRASIAVLPFQSGTRMTGAFADGLSHDIISGLARLRTFLVIARGSTFALRDRLADPREIGRALGVDYTATGSVSRRGGHLRVSAELCSTADGRVIWTNTFEGELAHALAMISNITAEIIGLLDSEVTSAECNRAMLKPVNSLNAWELYHRGLWHMYRFTNYDNTYAHTYFKHAVKLDPTFSRAYAGLSFTHWQNAFLFKSDERQFEAQHALDTARLGMLADYRDPAAHWAMGRALWLLGEDTASIDELNVAVSLSPNFAIGHYTLGFVEAQTGDPEIAIAETDLARRLSPLDPMLYAMCAARAFALFRLERFEEAAEWGSRAAHRPNAHAHVHAEAALLLACAGRLEESRREAAVLHQLRPGYCVEDFFGAFHVDGDHEPLYRAAARQIGIG
jgi:TolB-like protein/DNA-binding winged helix-turn-helix (wHTH) protein